MCCRHYNRWRRHGDPHYRMFVPHGEIPRISDVLARCQPVTESGCWIWTGGLYPKDSYGAWMCTGERLAHRVAYIAANGAIPDGLQILHICDVRECVNPAHLYAGTNRDNMNDMVRRRRAPHGEESHKTTLTADQALAIKLSQESPIILSRKYGISRQTVYNIRTGKTWKYLEERKLLDQASQEAYQEKTDA